MTAESSQIAPCSPERTIVYEQDCASYRFCDAQKWSRFQTATVIEGAILYGVFQQEHFTEADRVFLIAVGTIIVQLIFKLVGVEEKDTQAFLKRIKDYESKVGTPFPETGRRAGLGVNLTKWIIRVTIAFNFVVAAHILGYL